MTAKQPPPCTWDPERGWLTPEHQRDCGDSTCAGCRPCPKTHCAMRGSCSNHVDVVAGLRTCPACIGRTRRDLQAVVDLYALAGVTVEARPTGLWSEDGQLLDEAADAGVESEAFVLAGPAATPEQWDEKRRRLVASYEQRGWCEWPKSESLAEDDKHHPYAVLARWDMALREAYGPPTQMFVTVTSAANYLDRLLAGPFPHGDEFEDFARSVATLRSHMESVVHDSRTPELGRHCPTCVTEKGRGPRLFKTYASGDTEDIRAGVYDTWHCPDVAEHWWSEEDYRLRVAADYVQHATALTADQMAERDARIKPGTVRVWANRSKVRKRGTDHLGRQLYDVADVLKQLEPIKTEETA